MATRKELHEVLDWILDGKEVQRMYACGTWCDLDGIDINIVQIKDDLDCEIKYRLKPIEWNVGEKVWDVAYGWGEVDRIDETAYCLDIVFKNDMTECYNKKGEKIYGNRTLFKKEMKLTPL